MAPEQETARKILVAKLTEQIIRKMIDEKALEYTIPESTGKTGIAKQGKVEYAQEATRAGEYKMQGPQDLPEISAVKSAPSRQTLVTQAQRKEQGEEKAELGRSGEGLV